MSDDPLDVKAAMEIAFADGAEELRALAEIAAPNGVAYDQTELDDTDFVAWWIDLGMRPDPAFVAQFPDLSTKAFLAQVAPKFYAECATRYERVVGRKAVAP